MKMKKQNKTKTQTKPTADREAVRVLAIELGAREAARRLGIKESTVLSWARRYRWNLPKRKGGGSGKNAITLAIKPGDALIAAHEELEDTTKTGLMQALAKAARQVAGKEALDVSNTAQLRDICLAAARIFGWKGDSQVSVAVNADKAGVIVVTEEKRRELQERLKRLQFDLQAESDDSEKQSPAPITPPAPQTEPQANADAGNAPSGAPTAAQASPSPSVRALGFDLAMRESVPGS
jgi:Putative ATPase subunit of terminase (gpP-like)